MAIPAASGAVAAPRTVPVAPAARTHLAAQTQELLVVFGVVFGVCVVVAAWFMLVVGSVIGDALSRSLAAVTAARSARPKLASLGFIWPPLPGFLQIPFVHIPAVGTCGLNRCVGRRRGADERITRPLRAALQR